MNAIQIVRYDEFDSTLSLAGLKLSPAEVHGLICGSICNQMKTGAAPDLQRLLLTGADLPAESLAPLQDNLELLLRETVEKLYQNQGEFVLLLPDDDSGFPLRLQSLADWCKGFLLGLLDNQSIAIDELSADGAELARDMISVSEVDLRPWNDDSEWDFVEVEEYIRVGVQLIFEELYAEVQSDCDSGELH